MSRVKDITSFTSTSKNLFIFDTNVLLKIFYPALGVKNSAPYINLYEKIVSTNAEILISSIHISEFVNRCIRFQFSLLQKTKPNIKNFKTDYRNTKDYGSSMDAILEIVSDILSSFNRIDDKFNDMALDNLLNHTFSYDFNDALIAELSRNYKAILVTDDGDYANFIKELDIVTNNRFLLMFQNKN